MAFPDIPTLETERLLLRPLDAGDFEDYATLRSDPEGLRYLSCGPEPWPRQRSWAHLAFLIGHWQLRGAGMWALAEKATGNFLGVVGFAAPEGWPGFELAWALARRHWGNGYATEGARAALDYAFSNLEKEEVISLIHPANRASIRVAERLGQSPKGHHPMPGGARRVYRISRAGFAVPPG